MVRDNYREMSFLEHLEELRWAILKSVVAILVGMAGTFFIAGDILQFLLGPTRSYESLQLQFLKPAGMFMVRIYISLGCGFILALPVVLYQFWNFLAPGLLENEKKYIPYVIVFSTGLFILGGAFAFYLLIPVLVSFFILMGIDGVKAQWDIGEYMGLVIKMILLMGAVFQMPILIGFLTWIRILTPDLLKKSWRYALVIIFILAAVITPTGDPLTQTIVAAPLVVLYFFSLFVSSWIVRSRDNDEETIWARILTPVLLKRIWRIALAILLLLIAVITPTGDSLTRTIMASPLVVLYLAIVAVTLVTLYLLGRFVSSTIAKSREKGEEITEVEPPPPVHPDQPDETTIARKDSNDTGLVTGDPDYWAEGDEYFEDFIYDSQDDTPKRIDPDGVAPQQTQEEPVEDEEKDDTDQESDKSDDDDDNDGASDESDPDAAKSPPKSS